MISFTFISKNNEHRDLLMSIKKNITTLISFSNYLKTHLVFLILVFIKDYLGITIFKPINLYHALLFLFLLLIP
ncbi:hypothetical protein GLOIN_2v1595198 [Rhizophagus irregularis DAOM 181602=DAOM 197198]|uniref:Uncharacterized protein n=1 Tax=Rhizophagus irregularis (strain DAOM 181602 / DAOM 197198 / MUCL 43194) TaxID=747089 RepID=A0A2P4Q499_RHIID|nr:hypothetical protein GLOIN_2v1595198 [Rhizophagus irregularis DAOM 181602=DAOM 197198]POG72444.1 hypothetical protein GLOIN_2v1595198 [Rhizophagus irregularis DAOM 181602=DAOM 197198]|eukprot:XP_025179310.1 hypothetical protein GLOIN_2v1595198 [Rhizophagus irregularis DAOM 181602=DAOM 197198]